MAKDVRARKFYADLFPEPQQRNIKDRRRRYPGQSSMKTIINSVLNRQAAREQAMRCIGRPPQLNREVRKIEQIIESLRIPPRQQSGNENVS